MSITSFIIATFLYFLICAVGISIRAYTFKMAKTEIINSVVLLLLMYIVFVVILFIKGEIIFSKS